MKVNSNILSLCLALAVLFGAAFKCANNNTSTDGGKAGQGEDSQAGDFTYQVGAGKEYGSRDPRTCANTKAPAQGAITAALATKYVICKAEKIWSNDLYLVENVKVNEVGGGIPYQAIRGQYSWDQVDVNYPVYPIRGSLVSYQCRNLVNEYVGPPDANCATSNEPNASGHCYKTTFGDWKCFMSDPALMERGNYRTGVAPPKS